jgi:PTEN induced putative kinase 1
VVELKFCLEISDIYINFQVACAKPGPFTYINYSKADLWSAGTLAYEIFGQGNPFSGQSAQGQLHNRTYADEELPALPDEIPAPLRALVYAILARNPAKVATFFKGAF